MENWVLQVDQLSKEYRLGKGMLKNLSAREFAMDLIQHYLSFGKSRSKHHEGTTFWALEDVSFTVERGDTVGIIGRNGAGKSTLLKILSKITPPTRGLIRTKGRITSLLEVGTGFHPELSGTENIYLNGAILGLKRREIKEKFDAIVDFSGVEKFLDTPLKRYSSGMLVRLAFSVAAHLDPDLLIIDEVLAVGDLDFQKKCLQKMEDVSKSGRTIIFVSHNNEHILRICKKGLLLEQGKVIQQGLITDVIQRYMEHSRTLAASSLEQRLDRKGSGEIRIKKVQLLDEQQRQVSKIAPSEALTIVFPFEQIKPFSAVDLMIKVELHNSMGIKVFEHSNRQNGVYFNQDAILASKCFSLGISELPFPHGDYYLSYEVWNQANCIDSLQDAKIISIGNDPFGPNLRNPGLSGGTTLVRGIWTSQN
ncbi:MAG: ATP-binding cassette domain-containing protein [Saprospiraceae bacterium]|nr:ATP-binding cassette domain-containing protein [Saprospiraceae bacterium]